MNSMIFNFVGVLIEWNTKYVFQKEFRVDHVDNIEATLTLGFDVINFSNHQKFQNELSELKKLL